MRAMIAALAAAIYLWVPQAACAERLTGDMIRDVMDAADAASRRQDAAAVGELLGSRFYKLIEVPSEGLPAAARIDKRQYIKLIERGWQRTGDYNYLRKDVVVHVDPGGAAGESFSTIVEQFTVDGREMTSKVREYARYELEDGRAVIVGVDTQTLVGDTTPGL